MERKRFFRTKEGGLTIAFIMICIAFAFIMAGLEGEKDLFCLIGLMIIVISMLYSPFKVYVSDRLKKSK